MGALFLYSCEKDSTEVIDPTYSAPVISNITIDPDTVETTSSSPNITFTVRASVQSQNAITAVTVTLYSPLNELIGTYPMVYSGSQYTGVVVLNNIQCLLVGNYKVQLVAEDAQGLFSNVTVLNLPVVNTANQPPVVSGLIAPDTIIIPASGSVVNVLSVLINDPDGYCDIGNVQFNAFLPDGSPASGNPFAMFDDGNIIDHGDTVAMDSRFSEKIEITSAQTLTGTFVFKYRAIDRSGVSSAELVDSILVRFP